MPQVLYPRRNPLLFDGGLNTKFQKAIIDENESPECLNVIFEDGAVGTRGGRTKLNTTAVGSFVCDGLYTRKTDAAAETMVGFWNGTAFAWNGNSFVTVGSAQSIMTAGVRVIATNYENHLFVGNGYVNPYKWNGTDWTRHGVPAPTTTMGAATGAAGNPNGLYMWKATFVNSQLAESDLGPAITLTVASTRVSLTSIPTASQSFGVGYRRLYRTVTSGSTYLRLTEITDNSTTTYTDNTADASLGAAAPTDNGVPPLYDVILYHQDRLFMNDPANPNYVWYTNLGEPYTVASTNFMKMGDASGDIVRALGVYQNSIIVFCERSAWMIYMSSTTASTWQRVRILSPYGSKSPFSLFNYENKLAFAAMDNDKFVGIGAVAGTTLEMSTTFLTATTSGADLVSKKIETDMFLVQESYVRNISSIVFKNKAYIALTYGSGQTTNNRVYCFDYSSSNLRKNQKFAWSPFTGWNAAQFTILSGSLYFADSTATGFVYQALTTSYNDDGAAINSYFWTKEYGGNPGDENYTKDFRFANLLVDNAGSYYMNVLYRTDSDKGAGNTGTINLDPGGSLWGVMIWGTDAWGGGTNQVEQKFFLGSARGKRIQFRFDNQNTANQRFKTHWMTLPYNVRGFR